MKKPITFWIITYHHRYGVDNWPVYGEEPPDLDEEVSELEDFEPDRDEWLDCTGPFTVPDSVLHDSGRK